MTATCRFENNQLVVSSKTARLELIGLVIGRWKEGHLTDYDALMMIVLILNSKIEAIGD